MDIKVNGRTLSDRPLVLGVQGDNNVEELRFLVPRYTDAGVDLSLGIGYAVFRLPDGTDGHVSLTPEVLDTDENTVSLTLLVGSQMTEQKGSGKLCLKVAGLESAMWSSTICDMFVNGTIALPSPQPYSLFRTMSVGPRLTEDESEPPLTVTERTINIPAELQTIAVAQDENSETVKIVVPRYFDGQDLSVHDFILHTEMGSNGTDDILFNNQNGQMKTVEDSIVTLTWVLRPPQTSFEGKLNIQLLVQGDEFKWHSLIGELTIAKHITGDPVVPATPSMYEQWLAEVKEQADYVRSQAANIQTVVDEMDAIKDAPAAAERAEAAAAEAEKSAAESKGFRKFYSTVVPDANGNLDPSRPMTVGPAASVEIESAGDRIQSVTALGFTQQAGTGDPSPTNVRAITNGGLKLVKLVLTGAESWAVSGTTYPRFYLTLAKSAPTNWTNTIACTIFKPNNILNGENKPGIGAYGTTLYLRESKYNGSVEALKADLSAKYAAGDPVIVWYIPADESDATGLYAPIILTSGEYRATCLPLTAPLCEGDSVVSLAKSGCDVEVTFDGSSDEPWEYEPSNKRYYIVFSDLAVHPIAAKGYVQYSNQIEYDRASIVNGTGKGFCMYDAGVSTSTLYVGLDFADSLKTLKTKLAAHPLTVWYRSTNYTPAADIPVSLETHQQAVLVLDGTENWVWNKAGTVYRGIVYNSVSNAKAGYPMCSHAMPQSTGTYTNGVSLESNGTLALALPDFQTESSLADFKAYLAAQYAAGTPVTIVYQLATPITYAHPAVELEAATGDQLTYTVTGQSGGTVSVTLKPFQDGGNAKMADNAQQLDGLTLLAIKESMTPVGYIFSWAPVDDGPDLSTPAKVAAYFGFGTWAAYGAGQVLVGVDSGQTEFATVGKTGGEKTHTLSEQELPSVSPGVKYGNGKPIALDSGDTNGYKLSFTSENVAQQNIVAPFGGGQAHNNLQPYITVYRWQRIK